jgi:hypothetical protein
MSARSGEGFAYFRYMALAWHPVIIPAHVDAIGGRVCPDCWLQWRVMQRQRVRS